MRTILALVLAVGVVGGAAWAQSDKPKISRAADLPPISVRSTQSARALLEGDPALLLALTQDAAAQAEAQLEGFEIPDNATRQLLIEVTKLPDYVRRDAAAMRAKFSKQGELAQSPGDRLGFEIALAAEITARCGQAGAGTALGAWLRQRLEAAPPEAAQPLARQLRGSYAASAAGNAPARREATLKEFETAARKAKGQWPAGLIAGLTRFRWEQECVNPIGADLVKSLDAFVATPGAAPADIWGARSLVLEPGAAPVRIAIWDSGVDLALFKAAPGASFALGGDGAISEGPLLSDVKGDDAALVQWLKGRAEFSAGLASPEADAYAAHLKTLDPKALGQWQKRLRAISSASHGTATASVAAQSNPFAEIVAVADQRIDTWERSDIEKLERRTAAYQAVVQRLCTEGVRVVNISWGLSPALFEELLFQSKVSDPQARRTRAAELFALEKTALEAAIRGAPEILFVAAAGNDRNDASFDEMIPSGLSAPNLVTVGAVDRAGRAAGFTTQGPTVALYANGVDVPVRLPGGATTTLSGTSFAAPQVTNAAAKVFALRPDLTAAEVRTLLIETATIEQGLPLLNVKAAAAQLTS